MEIQFGGIFPCQETLQRCFFWLSQDEKGNPKPATCQTVLLKKLRQPKNHPEAADCVRQFTTEATGVSWERAPGLRLDVLNMV